MHVEGAFPFGDPEPSASSESLTGQALSLIYTPTQANDLEGSGLVRPRLGQGGFRLAVFDAYERACCVTGEHSLPVLEAAHIRPYGEGGEHSVSNGLPLRRDIHRLFDLGYVTVRPDFTFHVSQRLRVEYDNGRTYYELDGASLRTPRKQEQRPDPEHLTWHYEHRFRAS